MLPLSLFTSGFSGDRSSSWLEDLCLFRKWHHSHGDYHHAVRGGLKLRCKQAKPNNSLMGWIVFEKSKGQYQNGTLLNDSLKKNYKNERNLCWRTDILLCVCACGVCGGELAEVSCRLQVGLEKYSARPFKDLKTKWKAHLQTEFRKGEDRRI